MKTKLFTIGTLAILAAALTAQAAAGGEGTGTGMGAPNQPPPVNPANPNPGQNPTLLPPGQPSPNLMPPGQASGISNSFTIRTNQLGIGPGQMRMASNQFGMGSNSLGMGTNQFTLRTNPFPSNDFLMPTSRTNSRPRILQNPPQPPAPMTQPPRQ